MWSSIVLLGFFFFFLTTSSKGQLKDEEKRVQKEVLVSFETKSTFENFVLAHSVGTKRIVPMSVFCATCQQFVQFGDICLCRVAID